MRSILQVCLWEVRAFVWRQVAFLLNGTGATSDVGRTVRNHLGGSDLPERNTKPKESRSASCRWSCKEEGSSLLLICCVLVERFLRNLICCPVTGKYSHLYPDSQVESRNLLMPLENAHFNGHASSPGKANNLFSTRQATVSCCWRQEVCSSPFPFVPVTRIQRPELVRELH